MSNDSVTGWINQLADGNQQAAEQLWQHISCRLHEFARQKLNSQTRRHYDENDAANSAFHSLCGGLADGRLEARNRDALWGLLAVITSRKISAQQRYLNRDKRAEEPFEVNPASGTQELTRSLETSRHPTCWPKSLKAVSNCSTRFQRKR